MATMHMMRTISNDTKYQRAFGSFCIFSFKMSILQIVIRTSARVNMTLFQFVLKKLAVVNISKGTSDITPKISKFRRYFFRFRVLKKPSTSIKQNSGNAILPRISKMLLTVVRIPLFEPGLDK